MPSESTTPIPHLLPPQASLTVPWPGVHGNDVSGRLPELGSETGNLTTIYPSRCSSIEPNRLAHEVVAQLRGLSLTDGADLEVTVETLVHHAEDEDESTTRADKDPDDPQGDTLGSTGSRVTFRPRVRITSGLNHLRQSALYRSTDGCHTLSTASTRSCSPSSSISAPLRFHSEEPEIKPGWGTLGQRVSLLARRNEHKRRYRERIKQHERMLKTFQGDPFLGHLSNGRDERSPLLGRRRDSTSSGPYMCQCGLIGCEYDAERRLSKEIDHIFGKWPSRMWNPKFWWWHIQPIVCCRCLDDPDEEYYY